MRILIISDAWHPQVNGVVRTYESLIGELEQRGHTVCVIGPSDFQKTAPLPGYSEIRLVVAPYKPLARMIEAFSPDSLHIATEGPLGWAGRRYCKKHRLPFSTAYHTHFPDYMAQRVTRYMPFLYKPVHSLSKIFVRYFHKPANLILVATPTLKDVLVRWYFKNRMHVFTRGVDMNLFYPGVSSLFSDVPRPIALYVGRVAIEKNLEDFLKMKWTGSKIIVGEGPLKDDLSRQYPNAYFVGKKTGPDLVEHYRSADVFVFPSRTDTFGMVIVEALACGIPVAAYHVAGPKDIITHNFLGILSDADLQAAALSALTCGSPDMRAAYVRSHYTWAQAAQEFEQALQSVLIDRTYMKERGHGKNSYSRG